VDLPAKPARLGNARGRHPRGEIIIAFGRKVSIGGRRRSTEDGTVRVFVATTDRATSTGIAEFDNFAVPQL
jgi:hypothetical protein